MTTTTPAPNQTGATTTTPATPAEQADARVRDAIHAAVAVESDLSVYAAMSDRGERSRVRSAIQARRDGTMRTGMAEGMSPDAIQAEWHRLDGILSAMTKPAARPATPVDEIGLVAARIVALRAAADMIESGLVIPAGIEQPFEFGPDVDVREFVSRDVTADAIRLAGDRVVTRSGPTRDVGAAIQAAVESVDVGAFVSVADIGKHWHAAGGPSASDSAGRIRARLFAPNGCTVPGVEPVRDQTPQGARRIA